MKKIILFLLYVFSLSVLFGHEISTTEFFDTYIRKLEYSQKNLTYVHNKGIAKMGTETIKGEISGTLFYTVKIKGLGAQVIYRFTNFSVEKGWTFDGEILVQSDINQNGTFSGTITITGDMPGTVCYDEIVMTDGNPGSGYYVVQQKDKPKETIPYSRFMEIIKTLKNE